MTPRKDGKRTTYHDADGLHVATVIEHARPERGKPGLYVWYVAHNGGRAGTRAEAEREIERELSR